MPPRSRCASAPARFYRAQSPPAGRCAAGARPPASASTDRRIAASSASAASGMLAAAASATVRSSGGSAVGPVQAARSRQLAGAAAAACRRRFARVGVGDAVRPLARPRETTSSSAAARRPCAPSARQQVRGSSRGSSRTRPRARRSCTRSAMPSALGELLQLQRRRVARESRHLQVRRRCAAATRAGGHERAAQVGARGSSARRAMRAGALGGRQADAAGRRPRAAPAASAQSPPTTIRKRVRALEAVLAVGADLAGGAARAQELHRAARGQRATPRSTCTSPAPAAQVERAGVRTTPASCASAAVRLRRQHLGELGADVFSERHGRCARAALRGAHERARERLGIVVVAVGRDDLRGDHVARRSSESRARSNSTGIVVGRRSRAGGTITLSTMRVADVLDAAARRGWTAR